MCAHCGRPIYLDGDTYRHAGSERVACRDGSAEAEPAGGRPDPAATEVGRLAAMACASVAADLTARPGAGRGLSDAAMVDLVALRVALTDAGVPDGRMDRAVAELVLWRRPVADVLRGRRGR